jgi:hypothetical protein
MTVDDIFFYIDRDRRIAGEVASKRQSIIDDWTCPVNPLDGWT